MRLGFSSLIQGATYGPHSSAVYLASHPERQRTSFRTRSCADMVFRNLQPLPRAPGTIAGPMFISFAQDSLDFHSSLNGPFTGSLPAFTLMLSRLRGRAVRQTSHDLTKSGTFCIVRHVADLTDPTLKKSAYRLRSRGKEPELRALVLKEPGRAEIATVSDPVLAPNHLLLKVRMVGFCGSDLNSFRGRNPLVSFPRIPGHEVSATIVEGSRNPALAAGVDVTLSPYTSCGQCPSCRRGRPNACQFNETLGVQRDGAATEYIVAPPERIYPGKAQSQGAVPGGTADRGLPRGGPRTRDRR